jgi:hypothetical protein
MEVFDSKCCVFMTKMSSLGFKKTQIFGLLDDYLLAQFLEVTFSEG